MASKKSSFDTSWKSTYSWINPVPNENSKAYCKLCKKIFCTDKGEDSIKRHAEEAQHKLNCEQSASDVSNIQANSSASQTESQSDKNENQPENNDSVHGLEDENQQRSDNVPISMTSKCKFHSIFFWLAVCL